MNVGRSIAWPFVVLLMAAMVGWVAYAFFAPLQALIETTANSVLP